MLWKITIFNGKINYKWPFSIAMLNYQRVKWLQIQHFDCQEWLHGGWTTHTQGHQTSWLRPWESSRLGWTSSKPLKLPRQEFGVEIWYKPMCCNILDPIVFKKVTKGYIQAKRFCRLGPGNAPLVDLISQSGFDGFGFRFFSGFVM